MKIEEIRARVNKHPELLIASSVKFEAKLTFEQRCQILAAAKLGFKREIIARAFNVHRATVRHVISPTSRSYRDVRKRWAELGEEEFYDTFVTEGMLLMLQNVKNDPEVSMSDDELEAARSLNQPAANSRADKAKGPFSLYKELDGITIRMDCAWYPDPIPAQYIWQERPAGWYCRIVDAEMAVRLSIARKDGTGATDALIGEAPHTRTSSASVAFAASYLGADIV